MKSWDFLSSTRSPAGICLARSPGVRSKFRMKTQYFCSLGSELHVLSCHPCRKSYSLGWVNSGVEHKEKKAPPLITCQEGQQLLKCLTDTSNLVLQAFISTPAPRSPQMNAYLGRYSGKPRQAEKFNRNNKVFTAIGWLLLSFLRWDFFLWGCF